MQWNVKSGLHHMLPRIQLLAKALKFILDCNYNLSDRSIVLHVLVRLHDLCYGVHLMHHNLDALCVDVSFITI
jgi:hypothetical protein